MIFRTFSSRRVLLIILIVVIAGAFFNLTCTYGPPLYQLLASFLCQIIYLVSLMGWAMHVSRTVVDRKVRRLLVWMAILMMMIFFIRFQKTILLSGVDALSRNVNYWAGPCYILFALCSFLASLHIGRNEASRIDGKWYLLAIPAGILCIAAVTNDFHQMTDSFPEGLTFWFRGEQSEVFGILIKVWIATMGALSAAMFGYRSTAYQTRTVVLVLLATAMLLFFLAWVLVKAPHWLGRSPYQMEEVVCFPFVFAWTICCMIGVVPSNRGYQELFQKTSLAAKIVDRQGQIVFQSAAGKELTLEQIQQAMGSPLFVDPDTRLSGEPIHGGYLLWEDDFGAVNHLQEQLRDIGYTYEEQAEMLRAETRATEEQERLATQNRIYDRIAALLQPQLMVMNEKMDQIALAERQGEPMDSPVNRRRLSEACVYSAYVKRRSNLTLLAEQKDAVDVEELRLALRESIEYLKLWGAAGIVHARAEGLYPVADVLILYDQFQKVVEAALPDLTAIMVDIKGNEDGLTLRITLDQPAAVPPLESLPAGMDGTLEEEDDTYYVTFRTGGGLHV